MEVCGIEMAEAYELYTNAGNFENAMQMFFNPGATQNNALHNQTANYNDQSYENEYYVP